MVSQHPRHPELVSPTRSGRPRRALTGLRACTGGLAAVLLAGCASGPPEPKADPAQTIAAVNALLAPDPVVDEGLIRHLRACMVKKGANPDRAYLWPLKAGSFAKAAESGVKALPENIEAARSTGYVTAREHARSAPGQGLSEQDAVAWMGLHDDQAEGPVLLGSRSQGYAPDSCLHEASVAVFGTPSGGFIHQLLGVRLVDEARERARDSSDAKEAVQRWAECMKDKGETRFPSPADVQFKGSESEDGLKDVAVKDLECRAETDYTRRYHEALAAQLAPMLTEFAGEIEAYREMKAKAAERLTKG